MRQTSSTYKSIIASGNTRNWNVLINMTLADETALTITEANIMSGSFKISTASSSTDTFEIGAAVIGKCQFSLNNFEDIYTEYDFFGATAVVWIKLIGDSEYHRMGFYTVDEPRFVGSLIALELLDNMWKFDIPLSDVNLTFPETAGVLVNAICSHVGVSLATQEFNGYTRNLFEPSDEMNCREFLQYVAMLGCNFCVMGDDGNLYIKWYSVRTEVDLDGGTFDTTTTPYSDGDNADGGNFTDYTSGDDYDGGRFTDGKTCYFTKNLSVSVGTDEIVITGVKFVIDNTDYMVGQDGYVLVLENPFVTANNVTSILTSIWNVLEGFKFRTFNITSLPDIEAEVGDSIGILYKGTIIYSYATNIDFTPSLSTVLMGAETPTRSLESRYSKNVQQAVEIARRNTKKDIFDYDKAVQEMNNLAINALGAYQDYEDVETGGRYYYLSNRPITKVDNVCSFEEGSIVFKTTGEALFVSSDGGQTWFNGYDANTGQLLVNVLKAIGISAEWIVVGTMIADRIKGGTLIIGGVNNDRGRILACTNESEEISSGVFNGILEEIYIFGEGSDIPEHGSLYATNTDEYSTDCPQPVYITEGEVQSGDTGVTYWFQDPQYEGTAKYAMGIKDAVGDDDIYFFAYYDIDEWLGDNYLSVDVFGVSKSPFTYYFWNGWMDNDGEWESEQRSSWDVTYNGETYYLTDTGSAGSCSQLFRVTLDPTIIPAKNDDLNDFIQDADSPYWTVAHVILDGEIHKQYDRDWYCWDDDFDGYNYYSDFFHAVVHIPRTYYDLGSKIYINNGVTLSGYSAADAKSFTIDVPKDVMGIVINYSESYYPNATCYPFFVWVGDIDANLPNLTIKFGDNTSTELYPYRLELADLTDRKAFYYPFHACVSCSGKYTDIGSYSIDNIEYVACELTAVILWGDSHVPDPVYEIPSGVFRIGVDVSNISDPSVYEGLYQVYKTEDAGETFTQIAEDYLKDGNNFLDATFDIPTLEKDSKFYKILLTRSATTYTATYDYLLTLFKFITQIDKDGIKTNYIEAEGGNFGILEIEVTEDDTRLIIPKDSNVVYADEYRNFTSNITGTYTFVPYYLGWTQDVTLQVDFSADVTGATESFASCLVELRKKRSSNPRYNHRVNKYRLDSDGKIRGSGLDPIFSEDIDHEWGKNDGEYYEFKYTIYKRSFTTGNEAHIKLFDPNNNAQVGAILSKDGIISSFRGNFDGQGNFGDLTVGDWAFDAQYQKMIIDSGEDTPEGYDGTEIGRDGAKFIYEDDYAYYTRGEFRLYDDTAGKTVVVDSEGITNFASSKFFSLKNLSDPYLALHDGTYYVELETGTNKGMRIRNGTALCAFYYNGGVWFGDSTNYIDNYFNEDYGLYQREWTGSQLAPNIADHYSRLTKDYLKISKEDCEGTVGSYDIVTKYVEIDEDSITKYEKHTSPSSEVTYTVTWTTSDERVKEDIIDLDSELSVEFIDKTQPKRFKYKGINGSHYGMIAQETRSLLDDLGENDSRLEHSMGLPKEKTGLDDQRTIDYQEYIPHLINYVKELKAEITELKNEIERLKHGN